MFHRPLTEAWFFSLFCAIGLLPVFVTSVAAQTIEFTVQQEVPYIFERHLDGEGSAHVDILGFEADISTVDGKNGTLSGIQLTVDIPEGADAVFEDRIGNMVFDFGANDTIMVGGKTEYAMRESEMRVGKRQIRAVIGGTGAYIGARGQVTTSRNADGTYTHVFELLN